MTVMTRLTSEIPALRVRGHSVSNDERREMGRRHMSATMIWWLAQNDWSHPNFEKLATWALNEKGALHTSQVSHIRNGRMRMLGTKTLDAFGAVNLALWAYHNDRDALKRLGAPTPIAADVEALLKDAKPLLDPETGNPLDLGGWMNLYLGYIQIPDVVGGAKGDEDFDAVLKGIATYVSNAIAKSGKTPLEAKAVFISAFKDEDRALKLVMVGSGLDTYNEEELQRDFADICSALDSLDGKTRDPQSVAKELG